MRKISLLVTAVLPVCACALPVFAAGDFEPYIDSFVSDTFSDVELKVGAGCRLLHG